MPQLVGKICGNCNNRISNDLDAVFCAQCHNPVHNACVSPIKTPYEDKCTSCGTDLKDAFTRQVQEKEQIANLLRSVPIPPSEFEKTRRWLRVPSVLLASCVLLALGLKETIDPTFRADPKHVSIGELVLGCVTMILGAALGILGIVLSRRL